MTESAFGHMSTVLPVRTDTGCDWFDVRRCPHAARYVISRGITSHFVCEEHLALALEAPSWEPLEPINARSEVGPSEGCER